MCILYLFIQTSPLSYEYWNNLKTMGYTLILIGVVLLYFRKRNKFNRQNVAGVEEFKSFEH